MKHIDSFPAEWARVYHSADHHRTTRATDCGPACVCDMPGIHDIYHVDGERVDADTYQRAKAAIDAYNATLGIRDE